MTMVIMMTFVVVDDGWGYKNDLMMMHLMTMIRIILMLMITESP